MIKRTYEDPELNVILIEREEVITDSNDNNAPFIPENESGDL